jgi:DNA replication protein DnaC
MKIEDVIELCEKLKLKTIAARIVDFSNNIPDWKEKHSQYLCYIYNLLEFECKYRQELRALNLIKEARFPILKGLESFDFNQAPHLPEKRIRELANGSYISKAKPIIFLGESGTGKTHLATAIGYHNAELGHRVRFVTASHLANELIAAHDAHQLGKIVDYYNKFPVLILDELGFLPLSKTDAELIFQVLSKRHEQKPIIITTNLPFSEWTSIIPDARLCRAIVDRVTHRAYIIETGNRSARLAETLANMEKNSDSSV